MKINRSYVINYNYGLDVIRKYMESAAGKGATEEKRWETFQRLLEEQVSTRSLVGL